MANPQARNRLIARIHIAKKDLGLDDDTYRDVLMRVSGKKSSSQMSFSQMEAVIAEFKRMGWKPTPPKRANTQNMAQNPHATKIRALWLTLWQLGAVNDPSETAIEKFVIRMSNARKLHWITVRQADVVINALYGWLQREGMKLPASRTDIEWRSSVIEAQAVSKLKMPEDELSCIRDVCRKCWSNPYHPCAPLDKIITDLGKRIRGRR